MKKIITFLYLLILAYACYDDKGNYDYREINHPICPGRCPHFRRAP